MTALMSLGIRHAIGQPRSTGSDLEALGLTGNDPGELSRALRKVDLARSGLVSTDRSHLASEVAQSLH